jgi:putative tributyrin esterase
MKLAGRLLVSLGIFCAILLVVVTWNRTHNRKKDELRPDRPRLTAMVISRDVTFRSATLNREMPYRVILPANLAPEQKLRAVYLLHGRDGSFRDWSNDSDVAKFAEQGLLLVMPEGGLSYYTNSVGRPQDRYEDYIVHDLIADVESKYPVLPGRANRALVGISMGGFGAVKIALRHPEIYAFVGGMSSAVDIPQRSFSLTRIADWRRHREIFGPKGSQSRRDNDPFVLVRTANADQAPYFFLTCGKQESLLPSNREFAAILEQRHFAYEFDAVPGGHDWNQWNASLPALFTSLIAHLHPGT